MTSVPQCIICVSNLIGNDICNLPCGHVFHFACVSQWIKCSRNCPNCRKACSLSEVSKLFFDFFEKNVPQSSVEEANSSTEKDLMLQVEKLQNRIKSLTLDLNCCLSDVEEKYALLNSKDMELENKNKEIEMLLLVTNDYSNLKKEYSKMYDRLKLCDFYKKISKGSISKSANILDKYLNSDSTVNVANICDVVMKENRKVKSLLNESRKERKCLIDEKLRLQEEIYDKNNLLNMVRDEIIYLDGVLDCKLTTSSEKIAKFINIFQKDTNCDRNLMGFEIFPQKSISEKATNASLNSHKVESNTSLFEISTVSEFGLNDTSLDSKKILEKLVQETNKKENESKSKKQFGKNNFRKHDLTMKFVK